MAGKITLQIDGAEVDALFEKPEGDGPFGGVVVTYHRGGNDVFSHWLVEDLAQRELLKDTVVMWMGEFGRTPDNGLRGGGLAYGRDHNPDAMTLWLAGGGCNAGHTIGATDEIGAKAVDCVHHVRDFHVTLLRLLGLDDNRLTYFDAGRFKQLSQFGGKLIPELIG